MESHTSDPPVTRRHVLLATDLEASSAGAVDEAIELAAEQRAILLVLHVMPPAGRPRLVGRRGAGHPERERREDAVRAIVARAEDRGVTATSVVWSGDPAESIMEAAWTERVDVVVLGSRRRSDLGRLVHGSVSVRVADGATCPVLIVPS